MKSAFGTHEKAGFWGSRETEQGSVSVSYGGMHEATGTLPRLTCSVCQSASYPVGFLRSGVFLYQCVQGHASEAEITR